MLKNKKVIIGFGTDSFFSTAAGLECATFNVCEPINKKASHNRHCTGYFKLPFKNKKLSQTLRQLS